MLTFNFPAAVRNCHEQQQKNGGGRSEKGTTAQKPLHFFIPQPFILLYISSPRRSIRHLVPIHKLLFSEFFRFTLAEWKSKRRWRRKNPSILIALNIHLERILYYSWCCKCCVYSTQMQIPQPVKNILYRIRLVFSLFCKTCTNAKNFQYLIESSFFSSVSVCIHNIQKFCQKKRGRMPLIAKNFVKYTDALITQHLMPHDGKLMARF